VQLATSVVRLLDTLAGTPAVLARVTDAMRVYERAVLGQVTWQP
jgi:hypothetical protein